MKKYLPYILILIIIAGFSSPLLKTYASDLKPGEPCIDSNGKPVSNEGSAVNAPCGRYVLLAPLPGISSFNPASDGGNSQNTKLGEYLNLMIKIFIGLAAVLSVIMIVVGGLEVMTSELAHTKEDGKHRITGAILGLLIALGSWALLNTINPDLLKSDINPPDIDIPAPVVQPTTPVAPEPIVPLPFSI
ncbi:hypothetical protein A2643_00370 [Candidatus Nomurabacteria bacterium RIFCSPHIGHO2_01_FULL_39_220]|uniref:Uncharacterized protein n=1 Tax=Candidatus Nomurabacteria bacterium RIFCSPLOWO2_02_FULL_40_67 TaxID=1801787 RepID=A0A1F6Y401_9BACT|nr:MAG: hypothetical protein UU01_C0009G0018 [Parcubacteria group bacterium GW2011_GWA2_40_37]OGI62018.1 MAG: hypothetical protein A2W12_01510 [Candidatus Nomurabacteria bacterium RBG_16_40_11]OGI70231.1 MAG: hypothetical protein A2643_00370 [Candidatus Nomurabacteria bacterium RIFCSPHIGHO2_01_FULL_39_220]OGI72091.1 MAG: hypothetical protein A2W56_03855 [Candidatus Nomurabacteria bacterium RIFCSPHIGHO2_02_41_18]OGI78703.1 MAG: hypothetical protein A3C65_01900 [Candidatus Nomurabacteria bacteriu